MDILALLYDKGQSLKERWETLHWLETTRKAYQPLIRFNAERTAERLTILFCDASKDRLLLTVVQGVIDHVQAIRREALRD